MEVPESSPIMAGFECATQLGRGGRRHDYVAATRHDRLAYHDYALLRRHGIAAARDGLRWHLVEATPGRYDWASFEAQLNASREAGVAVIWDLLHYGWPDWADPLAPDFAARFAEFAGRAAEKIGAEGRYTPINEISFMAWAGGEAAYLAPFRRDCAATLKRALCSAAIAGARALRAVDASARIYTSEPLIHVVRTPDDPRGRPRAAALRQAQHDAVLTLLGAMHPELGGSRELVDVVGLNYYPHNQFDSRRRMLAASDPRRRPLSALLAEAQALYRKPLYLSETGAEDDARAGWLAQVCSEVRTANAHGAGVGAICLYPILNHLGWDDERYCAHGLFCGVGAERDVFAPLAEQIAREQAAGIAPAPAGALPLRLTL